MPRLRAARDPFWDMDGHGVRRDRRRDRMVGTTALVIAIAAVGLTVAVWLREIGPILASLHLA
jgi:hypothetical protein